MHSDAYTFRFAAIVTIVCSVLLSGAATLLKPRQVENEKLDRKKNILIAAGIAPERLDSFSRKEITELFKKRIKEKVIDIKGQPVEGKLPDQIDPEKDKNMLPIYEEEENGKVIAYVLPVSGKGLWSTIYGYLALETDCNTVKGITFYKLGETPGLGGEISKSKFTDQFKGKKIFDDQGRLVSIVVIKGKVSEKCTPKEAQHSVDGVSGATLTGRGVTHFLKTDLEKYKPFFDRIRAQEGGA